MPDVSIASRLSARFDRQDRATSIVDGYSEACHRCFEDDQDCNRYRSDIQRSAERFETFRKPLSARRAARDDIGPRPAPRTGCRPVAGPRAPAADRVELLLAADDPGGEGRPARQPLGRRRHAGAEADTGQVPTADGDATSTSRRCRTCSRPGGAVARGGEPARARPPHPGLRQRAGDRRRGRGRAGPPAAGRPRRLPARHPGAGARGVPDRVHHLRRDRLPRGDRLGRDVRPRPGRADGRRDRAGHGGRRRAPGPVAGAGRRARLPLGPGRGDHGRGPLPRLDARRRLRPGPAERRRHRHPEALRRLLGLPGGPQPRPRLDGPARAAWTSSCRRSRRPSPWPAPAR